MTSRGDCSFKREDQNMAFRTCVCHGQPRNSEKIYNDENLGENPKLSNRLMNFAEFASVRLRQNTVL